ncbi:MAG TPA: serine/threonine-protein kinase [Candidatus Bilamarchaeum sp.]|nr:serine/threonine-protein kinase [Candidatus Bilamarchaeum sp.]
MLELNRPPGRREERNLIAGRYCLIEEVGRGRLGSVHKALDCESGGTVALKFGLGDMGFARTSLMNEASALARVSHEGVAGLRGAGESEMGPFIVMDYVHGLNLRQLLKSGGMPSGMAMRAMGTVLGALESSHQSGVVHRDIKPKNVMIGTDGKARLVDFGFARVSGESDYTEKFTHAFGNPIYSPPEDLRGNADPRVDIYSAGVMLYELMINRNRFYFVSAMKLLELRTSIGRAFGGRNVPADALEIAHKATERDPEMRFQSARAMREALENIIV